MADDGDHTGAAEITAAGYVVPAPGLAGSDCPFPWATRPRGADERVTASTIARTQPLRNFSFNQEQTCESQATTTGTAVSSAREAVEGDQIDHVAEPDAIGGHKRFAWIVTAWGSDWLKWRGEASSLACRCRSDGMYHWNNITGQD
jgi:hypothetical protein